MATQVASVLDRVFRRSPDVSAPRDQLLWSLFRWLSDRASGNDHAYEQAPHARWKQHADQRNAVPLDYSGMNGGALYCRFMDPKSGEIIRITIERECRQ